MDLCVFLSASWNNPAPQLRKHIRTWRVEDVKQLGADRIVDIQFGPPENCYHLVAEFYARGNVLLTDGDYRIISVLLPHSVDETARYVAHNLYPFEKG